MNTRSFNSVAYDSYDHINKTNIVKILNQYGYTLISDINAELYKDCDLIMHNHHKNKTIKIENETRPDFDTIKTKYTTIHIPIRKINTNANLYIIWNIESSECMIFDIDELRKYDLMQNVVSVVCTHEANAGVYEEYFIDIPKAFAYHFHVLSNFEIKATPRNHELIKKYTRGFEMRKRWQ